MQPRSCDIRDCDREAVAFFIDVDRKRNKVISSVCEYHAKFAIKMHVLYNSYEKACEKANIPVEPKETWRSIISRWFGGR